MPKLDPAQMHEILSGAVPAGETLTHSAYGVRQPNMWAMVPAFMIAIVPGVILTQVLTKHYIVGTTQTRLVIAEFRPKWLAMTVAVKTVTGHRLIALSDLKGVPVRTKSGKLFTTIACDTAQDPFRAKFHRMFSKVNRPEAEAIAQIVAEAAAR